jgi:hypothetical protein
LAGLTELYKGSVNVMSLEPVSTEAGSSEFEDDSASAIRQLNALAEKQHRPSVPPNRTFGFRWSASADQFGRSLTSATTAVFSSEPGVFALSNLFPPVRLGWSSLAFGSVG